jgi:two-component system sensor histidine kinase/response regulator
MTGDREKCLEAGCNDYLSKPINRKELFRVLDSYLLPESTHLAEESDYGKLPNNQFSQSDCNDDSLQTVPLLSEAEDDTEIPIDWSAIIKNFEDEEMVKEMVEIYTEDSPQTIHNLNEAIKAKVSEEVQLHAHSLKGTSALIGADKLREKAYQLECAGEQNNIEIFDLLFQEVKEDFDKLMLFLSEANWMEMAKENDYKKQHVG